MKNIIRAILIVLTMGLVNNCKEDNDIVIEKISYPDNGFYGKNILGNDTIYKCDIGPTFGDGNYNSMKAILPNSNSKLKVEIKGKRLALYSIQGWQTNSEAYPPRYDNYLFEAERAISPDLKVFFCGSGNATIKIYENNDTIPTRIKRISLIN